MSDNNRALAGQLQGLVGSPDSLVVTVESGVGQLQGLASFTAGRLDTVSRSFPGHMQKRDHTKTSLRFLRVGSRSTMNIFEA